ncbi:ADP-ribosyltransferase-containing protein, partial [Helicobacter sp. T3_23-1059]
AEKIQEKMQVSHDFAQNLAKWHSDSHAITKEADGTPKIFYHATNSDKKFEIFDNKKIHSGYGFWFGDSLTQEAVQELKITNTPIYKVFLKIKKPFDISEPINNQNRAEFE